MKLSPRRSALSALLFMLWLPSCSGNAENTGDGDGDVGGDGDGDMGGDGDGDGDLSTGSGGTTMEGGTGGGSSSGGTESPESFPTEVSTSMSVRLLRTAFRANVQSLRSTAASQVVVTNPELLEGITPGDTGYRTLEAGDCSVIYIEDVDYVEPEFPGLMVEQTTRNAGRLTASFTVEGGVLSAELNPDASHQYPEPATFTPSDLFLGSGDVGTLTAEGNQIPGFSVKLSFPPALIATNPALASTDGVPVSTIEVSKSASFVVTWDHGAPGAAYSIQLASDSPGSSDQRLSCSFDSATGQGTIDASLLAHLDVGKVLDALVVSEVPVTAGDDIVTVRMIREVMSSDGMSGIKLVIVP